MGFGGLEEKEREREKEEGEKLGDKGESTMKTSA